MIFTAPPTFLFPPSPLHFLIEDVKNETISSLQAEGEEGEVVVRCVFFFFFTFVGATVSRGLKNVWFVRT